MRPSKWKESLEIGLDQIWVLQHYCGWLFILQLICNVKMQLCVCQCKISSPHRTNIEHLPLSRLADKDIHFEIYSCTTSEIKSCWVMWPSALQVLSRVSEDCAQVSSDRHDLTDHWMNKVTFWIQNWTHSRHFHRQLLFLLRQNY